MACHISDSRDNTGHDKKCTGTGTRIKDTAQPKPLLALGLWLLPLADGRFSLAFGFRYNYNASIIAHSTPPLPSPGIAVGVIYRSWRLWLCRSQQGAPKTRLGNTLVKTFKPVILGEFGFGRFGPICYLESGAGPWAHAPCPKQAFQLMCGWSSAPGNEHRTSASDLPRCCIMRYIRAKARCRIGSLLLLLLCYATILDLDLLIRCL
jgi:hypothetical protein